MASEKNIAGKKILITGGASGLGALFAETFLKEGATKVAIIDIAEEAGKATEKRLNAQYTGQVIFINCDMSKEEEIEAAFDKVVAEFGHLDVIINNAGIMNDSPGVWRKSCDVNVTGIVSLTLKGVKHMRTDEGGVRGTIINVASGAAIFKWRQLPIYAATKAAVLHFTLSLAEKPFYEETGVRLMVLCPGATDTALLQGLDARAHDVKLVGELKEVLRPDARQTPDAVAAAVVKIFREGDNGSTWFAGLGKPAKDITAIMDQHYSGLETLLFG